MFETDVVELMKVDFRARSRGIIGILSRLSSTRSNSSGVYTIYYFQYKKK